MHSLRNLKSASLAVIGLGAAFSLQAQTATTVTTPPPGAGDNSPQVMERFVITGSNIASADTALAVPLSVVGRQQIQDGGVQTNALDILHKISPSISGVGSENAN